MSLDFGGSVFTGNARWLEIAVAPTAGGFTTLAPRQQILPTPYAIMANTASNLTRHAARHAIERHRALSAASGRDDDQRSGRGESLTL